MNHVSDDVNERAGSPSAWSARTSRTCERLAGLSNLITGTIFVEVIFRVPGLGKFFVSSIYLRDYPMIMATMLLVATLWSFTYLASDLLYTVVDPRVRLFGKAT